MKKSVIAPNSASSPPNPSTTPIPPVEPCDARPPTCPEVESIPADWLDEARWKRIVLRLHLSHKGREQAVLRCLVAGQSDEAIAESLGLTVSTVRTYMERLFSKCGCHSRASAVAAVFKAYVAIRESESR